MTSIIGGFLGIIIGLIIVLLIAHQFKNK